MIFYSLGVDGVQINTYWEFHHISRNGTTCIENYYGKKEWVSTKYIDSYLPYGEKRKYPQLIFKDIKPDIEKMRIVWRQLYPISKMRRYKIPESLYLKSSLS